MIEFVLEPFMGPKPLRFGMSSFEVDATIGPPDFVHRYLFEQRRPHVTLSFEPKQDYMWEAVFKPGAKIVFHGHELFAEPDLISFLQRYDPNPTVKDDAMFFPNLGIRLMGFDLRGTSGFRFASTGEKEITLFDRELFETAIAQDFRTPAGRRFTPLRPGRVRLRIDWGRGS